MNHFYLVLYSSLIIKIISNLKIDVYLKIIENILKYPFECDFENFLFSDKELAEKTKNIQIRRIILIIENALCNYNVPIHDIYIDICMTHKN